MYLKKPLVDAPPPNGRCNMEEYEEPTLYGTCHVSCNTDGSSVTACLCMDMGSSRFSFLVLVSVVFVVTRGTLHWCTKPS